MPAAPRHRPNHKSLAPLRDAINTRLAQLEMSHWQIAEKAGLYSQAIHYLIKGHDCRWTSVADIAQALGLELYIGPPRALTDANRTPEAIELAITFDRAADSTLDEAQALGEITTECLRLLRRRRKPQPP